MSCNDFLHKKNLLISVCIILCTIYQGNCSRSKETRNFNNDVHDLNYPTGSEHLYDVFQKRLNKFGNLHFTSSGNDKTNLLPSSQHERKTNSIIGLEVPAEQIDDTDNLNAEKVKNRDYSAIFGIDEFSGARTPNTFQENTEYINSEGNPSFNGQFKDGHNFCENEEKTKKMVHEIIDKFELYKKQGAIKNSRSVDEESNVVSELYKICKRPYSNIRDVEHKTVCNTFNKLNDVLSNLNFKSKRKSPRSSSNSEENTLTRRYLEHFVAGGLESQKKSQHEPQVESSVDITKESETEELTGIDILSKIAQEMNMTNLEVAQKIAELEDLSPENLHRELQLTHDLQNNELSDPTPASRKESMGKSSQAFKKRTHNTSEVGKDALIKPKPTQTSEIPKAPQSTKAMTALPEKDKNDEKTCNSNRLEVPSSIVEILNKILMNLERLQQEKVISSQHDKVINRDESYQNNQYNTDCSTEGTPCSLSGLWNSRALGIAFDIKVFKNSTRIRRKLNPPGKGNFLLNVISKECVPPKQHHMVDPKWSFMGSTRNEYGGPFYMYTQTDSRNKIATFVGYCRVCGGIDTIFGSWAFALPSTDCQNVVTSFENKPDIMLRSKMEAQRREKSKKILYDKKNGKKKRPPKKPSKKLSKKPSKNTKTRKKC